MKKNKKLKKKAITLIKENRIKEALHILIELYGIMNENEKNINYSEFIEYELPCLISYK